MQQGPCNNGEDPNGKARGPGRTHKGYNANRKKNSIRKAGKKRRETEIAQLASGREDGKRKYEREHPPAGKGQHAEGFENAETAPLDKRIKCLLTWVPKGTFAEKGLLLQTTLTWKARSEQKSDGGFNGKNFSGWGDLHRRLQATKVRVKRY